MTSAVLTIVRRRARFAALAGALFSVACASDEPIAPAPLPGIGTFALRLVDDQAVPAPTFDDIVEGDGGAPVHLRIEASEGTFLVEPDGRYQVRVALAAYENGVRVLRYTYADFGRWRAEPGSNRRHFESEYVEGVRFTGTAGPGGVVIEHNLVGEGTTSRFAFGDPR